MSDFERPILNPPLTPGERVVIDNPVSRGTTQAMWATTGTYRGTSRAHGRPIEVLPDNGPAYVTNSVRSLSVRRPTLGEMLLDAKRG